VVLLLGRQDTGLKILVFVNYGQLSFPNGEFANFFSIAYDTLRQIDDDGIFTYYSNHTFESKRAPLDVNSTSIKESGELGIKIFYDKDYRLGSPNWSDIVKAIVYGAKNAGRIKKEQLRDTVRYNTNGWYVSLLTLDTLDINKILANEPQESATQKKTAAATNNLYFIIPGIGLVILVSLLLVRRQHSRSHTRQSFTNTLS
jgi:hypothetical protein